MVGEATAHTLLRTPTVLAGFERLRREEILGHSIEALVLDPHYAELFAEHELEMTRRQLEAVGFNVRRT